MAICGNLQQFTQATYAAYMFVTNCYKSPQNRHKIAKIATYAGFADPDFRLRQRAPKKFPDGGPNLVLTWVVTAPNQPPQYVIDIAIQNFIVWQNLAEFHGLAEFNRIP